MPALNASDPDSFQQIEALIARIGGQWLRETNVLEIVPALKTAGGVLQPEALVLGFHVSDKLPLELLADRGYTPIPPEIEGIATDVILARRPALGSVDTKDTRSQMFDTLVGGIAIGNANMKVYGTLATVVLANSDSRMVGLTNEHVLVYDGDGHVGDEVDQPRFYLNSEVSLDPASCCPNGQLHYRGVDNPYVDAAAATFAAAAAAAALSDVIDPHRRGQDATVPKPTARTTREVVSVTLDYPDMPLPGTPYNVGVAWNYQRETDQGTLTHAVNETQQNAHVLETQILITDRRAYHRGDKVTFLAALGGEAGVDACSYFVTAAALSPSHLRAYKIVLRPIGPFEPREWGETTHVLAGSTATRCLGYSAHQPIGFTTPEIIDGVRYDPGGATATLQGATGTVPAALRLPGSETTIALPRPAQRVRATILLAPAAARRRGKATNPTPTVPSVTMTALSGGTTVGTATANPATTPTVFDIAGDRIDTIKFSGGGGAALLEELCLDAELGPCCIYEGSVDLSPNEELGQWTTYLFAQTRNTAARGIEPTIAATIIGGLPVTANFIDAGGSESLAYGHHCNVEITPDGDFTVLATEPPVIY